MFIKLTFTLHNYTTTSNCIDLSDYSGISLYIHQVHLRTSNFVLNLMGRVLFSEVENMPKIYIGRLLFGKKTLYTLYILCGVSFIGGFNVFLVVEHRVGT